MDQNLVGSILGRSSIQIAHLGNQRKRNETKRNEINKNETKRNEINEMKTK